MARSTVAPLPAPSGRTSVVRRPSRERARRAPLPVPLLLAAGAAATSTWTGFRPGGVQVSDLLIVAALGVLVAVAAMRRLPVAFPAIAFVPPLVAFVLAAFGLVVRGQGLLDQSAARLTTYSVGSAVGGTAAGPLPFLLRLVIALTMVAMICHLVARIHGRRGLHLLLTAWAVGAATSGGVAVVEHVLGLEELPFLFRVTTIDRSVGLAFHPNSLAQSLTMALPVLLYLAFSRSGTTRVVMAVLVATTAAGLFFSGSRAGLVGGATALVVSWGAFLLITRRYTAAVATVLLGALAVAALLAPDVLQGTRFGSGDATADQSTSLRVAILEYGWALFRENPVLGAGVGSWSGESVPLIMLTSGGLVLLLAFYVPFVGVLLTLVPHARTLLGAVMVVSVLVLFAYGFLNNGFGERYLYWPMFIGLELFRRALPRPDVAVAVAVGSGRGRDAA